MRQKFVEINFAKHRAQSGLGKLLRLPVVVLDARHRLIGAQHFPVHHRIHFQGDVVAGDDVLRRDFQRLLAQVHAHHAVQRGEDQDNARAFRIFQEAAQAEDHAALVLAQDLDGIDDVQADDDDSNKKGNSDSEHVC